MTARTWERVTLHHGDCLAVLRELPDASVDAVVTDPPYGLSDIKPDAVTAALTAWAQGDRERVPGARGFMGRSWDAFVPPPAVWDECLRVLKPGGHLLAFAGSRTADLMGLSVRMAGFEIRDTIMWVYGCLTADAEILTEHGWKPGLDVERGERVAQWDPATGGISLAPVEETFRAPWDGPMRVLRNADTDQVLTPNHRVYHQPRQRRMVAGVRSSWYEPEWQVAEAAELSTWNPLRLPIAGIHEGTGIGGDDYAALLGWVWTEGGLDLSGTGVRVYQSSVNAEKVDEIAALMDRLGAHKRYDRGRVYDRDKRVSHAATGGTVPRPTSRGSGRAYTETMWFISGELAERVRADLPGKRPTYDLLWRMTASEKRAMLQAALLGDGSRQRNTNGDPGAWQFYQQYEDDLVWLQTLLALVGQAGKVGMRANRPGGAVYLRDTATTELQARHLRDSSEHYTGEVWCVRVPTGAFVARRNGRVFITGNSGFPKGQDVGKAIDKVRDDRADIVRVTGWLAEQRDRAGWTNRQIDDAFGTNGMAGHWTSVKSQPAVPTWEQWGRLRELLGFGSEMDAEVWRLNGRKGTPGEAWQTAEVLRTEDRMNEPSGIVNAGQGERTAVVREIKAPNSVEAARWEGWNTSLKPAHEPVVWAQKPFNAGSRPAQEPIIVARKPLAESSVAANVLAHGTGGINVDACRVATSGRPLVQRTGERGDPNDWQVFQSGSRNLGLTDQGRWPANVVLVHDPACRPPECADACPVAELDRQSGTSTSKRSMRGDGIGQGYHGSDAAWNTERGFEDSGGASRFFPVFEYADGEVERDENGCVAGCPVAELDRQSGTLKSGGGDRGTTSRDGLMGPDSDRGRKTRYSRDPDEGGASRFFPVFRYQAKAPAKERPKIDGKGWPTVKPRSLMAWLARLVCPPGGTILDPFAGTGSTLQAARDEGFAAIGIERDEFAYRLSCQRLDTTVPEGAPPLVEPDGDEVARYAPTAADVEHDAALVELLDPPSLFDLPGEVAS